MSSNSLFFKGQEYDTQQQIHKAQEDFEEWQEKDTEDTNQNTEETGDKGTRLTSANRQHQSKLIPLRKVGSSVTRMEPGVEMVLGVR